jgi:3',5'-nucleoside bisphosphate phosphatase
MTNAKRRRLLKAFIAAGGVGLEVVSGSHNRDECLHMAQLAREFGLFASAGSDYHGPESPWIELGAIPPLPEGVTPIWRSWSSLADALSA